MKKLLLLLTLLGACVSGVFANNIRIIGLPVLEGQNEKEHSIKIKFDLAWDNSWRTSKPNNYDAAWIFVKCWDGESWNHVYLEKDSAIAGSTKTADAVNSGTKYYVSSRDGLKTTQPMTLEPGYSVAWKKWQVDPKEDSAICVVGFFLHRSTSGAGHVVVPGISFKWNYGNQGFVDEDDLVVKVFAVEMVFVPAGDYYLGGRGTAATQYGSFTTSAGATLEPYVVTSEKAITVNNTAGATTLWALNNGMVAGTIPATYPKGYQAFYIMKYELSQEAWCEFLNSLNQGQQNGRVQCNLTTALVNTWAWGSDLSAYRNYVKIKQAAPSVVFGCDANLNNVYNQTDNVKYDDRGEMVRNIDGQDLAMNFVSFDDLLAYAEFAGLRPMTELEYEKACRGTREPVNDEYAWGSVTAVFFGQANPTQASYGTRNGITNLNTGTEIVGPNFNVGYVRGWSTTGSTNLSGWWYGNSHSWSWTHTYYPAPLRVGIFADSTSTRAEAGATFWGVMNMSDNVAEMCISAYDTTGRSFVGTHGCGQLNPNGAATHKDWHMTTNAKYYICRGMMFNVMTGSCSSSASITWRSWWATGNNWWACKSGYGVNYPGVPAANATNAAGRVTENEINWNVGNMNSWQYYAGMISSRHMFANTIIPSNRAITTNGTQANGAPMRGIRCVRTYKAEK
ncbi:SUMF1/EgtB/PvdO family nonheme iron enzyme [bacterium]|nr:SUMF1/EgtB/PvdO family nonheme iron enzyme [bacterium]